MRIISKIYSISDFLSWEQKEELNIQPRFQRRDTWSPSAKSYLIDTIIKGFPIPKIFLREQINLEIKSTIREVVDGQQRLRAILDFISGNLEISRVHNRDLAGMSFDDLPEELKKEFLSYPISTDLLVGFSDADVLNVFSRINSYTLTLNQQEKLNAEFIGPFKQTIYFLALSHHEFWVNNNILTDRNIARMYDAELVSEIVIGMVDGLQGGKAYIRKYYESYEIEFPYEDRIIIHFNKIIDLTASIFSSGLTSTPFSRSPLFMSLDLALYDVVYGLGSNSSRKMKSITAKSFRNIYNELMMLGEEISISDPSPKFEDLYNASTRRTTNLKERKIRHEYFKEAILRGLT